MVHIVIYHMGRKNVHKNMAKGLDWLDCLPILSRSSTTATKNKVVKKIAEGKKLEKKADKLSNISRVPRDVFGNKSKFLRFCYNDNGEINTSTTKDTLGTNKAWYLNGIARPRLVPAQASGDLLSQGFDEIENVFTRYKVYGCKYRLKVYGINQSANYSVQAVIGMRLTTDNAGLSGKLVANALSERYTYDKILTTEKDHVVFSGYVDIAKLECITKKQLTSDISEYTGVIDSSVSNPSNLPQRTPRIYFAVSNSGTTDQLTLQYELELEYYTLLTMRANLLNSTSST